MESKDLDLVIALSLIGYQTLGELLKFSEIYFLYL